MKKFYLTLVGTLLAFVANAALPETLTIRGVNGDWGETYPASNDNGFYRFENITFNSGTAEFHFIASGWNDRYIAAYYHEPISRGQVKSLTHYTTNGDGNDYSFEIPHGTYNITVRLDENDPTQNAVLIEPEQLFIVGTMNDWDIKGSNLIIGRQSYGIYTGKVTANFLNQSFYFSCYPDWGKGFFGPDTNGAKNDKEYSFDNRTLNATALAATKEDAGKFKFINVPDDEREYTFTVDMFNRTVNIKYSKYPKNLYLVGNITNWETANAIEITGDGTGRYTGSFSSNAGLNSSFRFLSARSWNSVSFGPGIEEIENFYNFNPSQSLTININEGSNGNVQFYSAPADRTISIEINLADNGRISMKYDGDQYFPDQYYMLISDLDHSPNPYENQIVLKKVDGTKATYSAEFNPTVTYTDGDNTTTTPIKDVKFRFSDHNGYFDGKQISANYGSYGASSADKNLGEVKGGQPCTDVVNGNYNNWIVSKQAPGMLRVTLDMSDKDNQKVTVECVPYNLEEPENLYLIGSIDRGNWGTDNVIKFSNEGNGKYVARNVVFNLDDDYSYFQLVTARGDNAWASDRVVAPYNDAELSPDSNADMAAYKEGDPAQNNFKIRRGIYNVTADFSTGKISVEELYDCYDLNARFTMGFWDGPLNEALRPGGIADNEEVDFDHIRPADSDNPGERYIFKLKIADNIDPIKYVSQMRLGGFATYNHYKKDGDRIIKEQVFSTNYTNSEDNADTYWKTLYFDAHSNDALVPVVSEFWGDNSRMEVGLTVKAVYIRVNTGADFDKTNGETPIEILLSSDGEIALKPVVQRPFNSDNYAISLSSGELYNALKGTRSGEIKIPFVRHNTANEGYVINLGKYITTSDVEKFRFMVNGRTVNKNFRLSAANTVSGATDGSISEIAADSRFNQIILIVKSSEYGKYDTYEMMLRADGYTPYDGESYGYNVHDNNPLLKVWGGNDGTWNGLIDSNQHEDFFHEGSVRYFEFQPVTDESSLKTNLYYLDLSGKDGKGVKVRKGKYETPEVPHECNKNGSKFDQFNIVDQDGYDVSNPYQGSQFIYPGAWWCANPNLLDDENGTREYQGHKFKEVPITASRVDLAFNLTEEQGDEITIYGITLFKIVGNVYDIYAEAEREKNVYYLYAHTEKPQDGVSLIEKCRQTAPIMLRIKNINRVESYEAFDQAIEAGSDRPVLYNDKYISRYQPTFNDNDSDFKNSAGKNFNDPQFKQENYNYTMWLSDKRLASNSDLNYVLEADALRFYPGNASAFEFVDVSGSQRWSAEGIEDALRPNKWSNYYAGDFTTSHELNVYRPKVEYYKAVLATNPDQVRYQIMSYDMSITADPELIYSSTSADDYDPADKLIYPVTDISTLLIWRSGSYIVVDLTATYTDENGVEHSTYMGSVRFESIPEGTAIDDPDGFYKEGESPFEVSLGRYFTQPGITIKAEAKYYPEGSTPGESEPTHKYSSADRTTQQLPVPVLENLQAEAGEYDENGTYNANLTWETDDVDYPRHYEFYHYDLTGSDDKESVPADGINSVNCHHSSETTASLTTENATTLDNGETNGDQKEVTIGYRGHALYHFAVPENGAAEFTDDISYAELPANFMQVNTWSHEGDQDDLDNHQFTTALFAKEVSTGVEEVAADNDAPVEYYNLQGVRVDNPANGIFIRRQGNKVEKVIVK